MISIPILSITYAILLMLIVKSEETSLTSLLSNVVGVYKEPPSDLNVAAQLKRTVLLTASNYGFLNHLLNYDCFMQRLHFKYLVVALDKKLYSHLTTKTSIPVYYLDSGDQELSTEAEDFRTKKYNQLVMRKIVATLQVLKLGYDVLFCDPDIAVLRDPIPKILWQNVDYVHTFSDICTEDRRWNFLAENQDNIEGNTGFYYVKASNRSIKLYEDTITAAPNFKGFDDQRIFWKTLRLSTNPPLEHIQQCRHYSQPSDYRLVACMLDSCLFSSGGVASPLNYGMLQRELKKANESMYIVHATYIVGNRQKMNQLKKFGLWVHDQTNDNCVYSNLRASTSDGEGSQLPLIQPQINRVPIKRPPPAFNQTTNRRPNRNNHLRQQFHPAKGKKSPV